MEVKTDLQIFTESYNKYKDKTGRKAMALQEKIDSIKFLNNLFNKYCNTAPPVTT